MKLYDLTMILGNPDQKVVLINKKSRRIMFEGTAMELLEYTGLDHRKVSELSVKDGVLHIEIKEK